MADLTRFDFNAHNFLNSEAVEVMTDAEIGQYIMLMAKSWALAKGASLPDEPELLAKWAHCKKVSERVLAKFPVVDTEFGPRRRNQVLFTEWLRTLERHETAVELGRKGGMSTSISKIEAARQNGHFGGRPKNPSETQAETEAQTNPIIPNQSKPIQVHDSGDFKNLAVRYRRAFETRLGGSKTIRQRYAEACREYSEPIVLEMFDAWAPTAMWIHDLARDGKLHTDGMKGFYENLPELIEIESAAKKDIETAQQNQADQEEKVNASIEAGHVESMENLARIRKELEEQDAAIRKISEEPSALFGAS